MLAVLFLYLAFYFVFAVFIQVWVWDDLTWKDRDRRAELEKRRLPDDD